MTLGNYRLIYRVLQEGVQVITIYHRAGRLDPARLKQFLLQVVLGLS